MANLLLKGVMYGADKIPDAWFDKVPGNYFKAKEQDQRERGESQDHQDNRDRRRYSEDYEDRQPQHDDYDRRGDERRRDSHRSRSSYDRDSRRYNTNDRHHDSRRGYDDDDDDDDGDGRHGHDGGYGKPNDDRHYDNDIKSRRDYRQPSDDRIDELARNHSGPLKAAVESGFAAGVAAAHLKGDMQAPTPRAAGEAKPYTGYVPYADIYGGPGDQNGPSQPFSPPPLSSTDSAQPHGRNKVSPSRAGTWEEDNHRERDKATRPGYDGQYEKRDKHNPDERASRNRSQRPELRSRSFDSYDSRYDNHGPPPARNAERHGQTRDRGKSSSRLSTAFDKSQRGLGYSAVGAVAGGLVGSGVGKGAVPTTIGAVLGGLGANMFEARERRRETARNFEYSRNDGGPGRREQRDKEKRERNGDWKD